MKQNCNSDNHIVCGNKIKNKKTFPINVITIIKGEQRRKHIRLMEIDITLTRMYIRNTSGVGKYNVIVQAVYIKFKFDRFLVIQAHDKSVTRIDILHGIFGHADESTLVESNVNFEKKIDIETHIHTKNIY